MIKPSTRKRRPFWRRKKPQPSNDIRRLRPKSLPKGQRFETRGDALLESERSEQLLRSYPGYRRTLANTLRDCREGEIICDQVYCPLCARRFRRYLFGQLHRIASVSSQRMDMMTVLLEAADRDRINGLDPAHHRHALRKRLDRAGLPSASVIGGYEMVYRQREGIWVLHANLLILGGTTAALERFARSFKGSGLYRPTQRAVVKDLVRQLSYLLKFTTYHRPYQQQGPGKGVAVPLNPPEHHALVQWMSGRSFPDYLFLYSARRHGSLISLAA